MPVPRQSFYFSASTQFSNAGDALINRELLNILRQYGILKVARAGAPAGFLDEIQVSPGEISFDGKRSLMASLLWNAILHRRTQRQYLVLTPGDPPGDISIGDRVRALLFPVLKLFGIRIIKIGASLSRMSEARLAVEARLSRSMYFYGIRDNDSIARAQRSGFSNFEYCPDLAFALPVNSRHTSSDESLTLVSLREDNLTSEEIEALHMRTRALIESIDGTGGVGATKFISQVERDEEPMHRLSSAWRGSDGHARHLSRIADLESAYAEAAVVISNRLHVILLAASQGALPLCVPTADKNRKITELLRSIGAGSLVMEDAVVPAETQQRGREEIQRAFSAQRALLHDRVASKLGQCE